MLTRGLGKKQKDTPVSLVSDRMHFKAGFPMQTSPSSMKDGDDEGNCEEVDAETEGIGEGSCVGTGVLPGSEPGRLGEVLGVLVSALRTTTSLIIRAQKIFSSSCCSCSLILISSFLLLTLLALAVASKRMKLQKQAVFPFLKARSFMVPFLSNNLIIIGQ